MTPLESPPSARAIRGVSVVVPVSERPRSLAWIYEEYSPPLRETGDFFEFVFVIPTWAKNLVEPLRELRERGEPIRVLEVGRAATESAMLAASLPRLRGDLVMTLPPYARVEATDLPVLIREVRAGTDLVTARRRLRSSSWLNRIQNSVFHTLLRTLVGCSFRDIASGVRVARREILDDIPLYGDFFRFLPVIVQREGFQVDEVEVAQHPDDQRTRVYGPGVYIRRLLDLLGLFFLVRFTHKPLRFFGLVGSVFAVFGTVILLILFFQRLGGRGVGDRPLLLLGVLGFALGIQTIAIGLVGEIIVHFGASRSRLYRVRERTAEPGTTHLRAESGEPTAGAESSDRSDEDSALGATAGGRAS